MFSIVIPTRNRAHLLKLALESALSQTIDDFEVVVSDNGSNDETATVAQAADDRRVRYARTPADLSMPDSWNFALEQAQGEYITYLCDDDAILPTLLESLHGLIASSGAQVISWNSAHYYHSNWFEPSLQNTLQLPSFSSEVRTLDPRLTLRGIFDTFRAYAECPRMLQSACQRGVIDRVLDRAGCLFHPMAPDYAAAMSILSQVKSHVYWDFPWHVIGTARESNRVESLAYDGGQTIRRFFAEFERNHVLVESELPGYFASNVIMNTLLRMKAVLTPELDEFEINRARYFQSYHIELSDLRRRGADVSGYEHDLRRVMGKQAWREMVNPGGTAPSGLVRRGRAAFRRVISGSAWLSALERQLRPSLPQAESGYASGVQIDGSIAGFSNIAECARFAGGNLQNGFAAVKDAWT